MFDVDHLKQVNDTYGHSAGDLLLQEVARCLHTRFRGEDIVCRYGGDEFVIILPGASSTQALQRAEQLHQAVHHLNIEFRGQTLPQTTLSLGVVAHPEHGVTLDSLLRAADMALYQAKAAGRDRVILGR